MEKISFNGTIKDGHFELNNKENYHRYIANCKDGEYTLTLKRKRNRRSLNQNNLYWEWISIIGNELGYEKEEIHCTLKAMFLVDRSKKIPIIRSSANLNSFEFSQYMEQIDRWCAEQGILLPLPSEI